MSFFEKRAGRFHLPLVYVVAGVTSLLLSLWISSRETVINPDAICYVMSAIKIGDSGIQSAIHLCPQAIWPFYSWLIYQVSSFLHLSTTVAAFCLDGLFTLISVLMFIVTVEALGGSKRVLWYAAAVILLSHEFNSVRQYIVRDHGFWAFYLASVFFLIRFMREPGYGWGLAWSMSLIVATLFRIEGAIFLMILPFITFFDRRVAWSHRLYHFFMLAFIMLMAVSALVVWLLLHSGASLEKLGRVAEIAHQVRHGLSMVVDRYQSMRSGLIQYVIPEEGARDVNLVLSLVLVSWYVANVIGNLSLIFALLVVYAWVTRAALWTRTATWVVFSYLFINLFISSFFFAEHLFLSKRYLIACSLIFMLWVPFALDKLQRKSISPRYRAMFAGSIVMIVFSALGGIFQFGHSKTYVREAGDWLALNVKKNESIYVNDIQLMYYSKQFDQDIFQKLPVYRHIDMLLKNQWKQYDYLALRITKKEASHFDAVVSQFHLKPIATFMNQHNDQVLIFKVPRREKIR